MVPTCCDINSQSAWDTPSGLSIEMRTNWFFPPPLTSTSTTSIPSEAATRSAISSMRDDISGRIRSEPGADPTKKWAFAHSTGSTLQLLLYNGWGEMQVGWRGVLYFAYNFMKVHTMLRTTPAMAAIARSRRCASTSGRAHCSRRTRLRKWDFDAERLTPGPRLPYKGSRSRGCHEEARQRIGRQKIRCQKGGRGKSSDLPTPADTSRLAGRLGAQSACRRV